MELKDAIIPIEDIEAITKLDLHYDFILPQKYLKDTYTINEFLSLSSVLIDRAYFDESIQMIKQFYGIKDVFIRQQLLDVDKKWSTELEKSYIICQHTIKHFI